MYPIFQAYDSVALDVDAEVGGTDQTFNMLRGRDLMMIYRKKEKFVITTPLLENPATGRKLMSKSEGGFVALDDKPEEMYGKIMALPDEAIIPCLKLCTKVDLGEIKKIENNLKLNKSNPRDIKSRLAGEIVGIYHGENAAEKAEKEFNRVFRDKGLPANVPTVSVGKNKLNILDLLAKTKTVSSKAEAKRLILQGGVKIDGKVQKDWQKEIVVRKGMLIQVGKRKIVKIK